MSGCITTGARAGYCRPGAKSAEEKLAECLLIGSRIGRTLRDIADLAYTTGEGDRGLPLRARLDRDYALTDAYALLEHAVGAARKSCGWYDDSALGHQVEAMLSERLPVSGLREARNRVASTMTELKLTEGRAVSADPPLFRNLRRAVRTGPDRAERRAGGAP